MIANYHEPESYTAALKEWIAFLKQAYPLARVASLALPDDVIKGLVEEHKPLGFVDAPPPTEISQFCGIPVVSSKDRNVHVTLHEPYPCSTIKVSLSVGIGDEPDEPTVRPSPMMVLEKWGSVARKETDE